MEEKKEKLFLYKIYENADATGTLLFLDKNGNKIRLKAKGFYKENSVNFFKFKEFSFLEVEWIEYKKDSGLLKRGDVIYQQKIENRNQLIFISLVKEMIIKTNRIKNDFYEFVLKVFEDLNFYYDYKTLFIFLCFINFNNLDINFKINGCTICGKNHKIKTFSFHSGGLVCSECFDSKSHISYGVELTKKIIFAIKANNYSDFININFSNSEIRILERILIDYYGNELGFYIDNLLEL